MTREQQEELITDLCDGMKKAVLARKDRIPAHWDGFEIRQWLADYAKEHIAYTRLSGERNKTYKNDVRALNL